MNRWFRKLISLMLLFVLSCTPFAGVSAGDRGLVEGAAAWEKEGEIQIQLRLAEKWGKVELYAFSGEDVSEVSFERTDRLSVTLEGAWGKDELFLQLRSYDNDELIFTGLYRLEGLGETDRKPKSLKLKRSRWESNEPSDGQEVSLELVELDKVPGVKSTGHAAEQFFKRFYGDKHPEKSKMEKFTPRNATVRQLTATFELEPNDVTGKADWIYSGKDAYGKIGKAGDVDYWKIKAAGNGRLKVWLGGMAKGKNYDLHVYDAEGQEIGRSTHERELDERIELSTEKSGWYYIKVSGRGSDHDKTYYYRLKAEYFPGGIEIKPDAYEPNNRLEEATVLEPGKEYKGSIHARNDADFYRYQIHLSSTMQFHLTGLPQGVDLDLYLLNSKGAVLAKSELTGNRSEQLTYNGDPGVYYVKVASSSRSATIDHQYRLLGKINTIPVILVPGVGGTVLQMENGGEWEDIWLTLSDTISDHMIFTQRRALTLKPKSANSTEVVSRNGVKIRPESEDHGLRGINYLSYNAVIMGHASQYIQMNRHLVDVAGYVKGKTLFGFPYDWRFSNAQNANDLAAAIDKALAESGAKQVQLVVHSMGGLLTRETLLSKPAYQGKVKRIIYMGTPFLGSPRAYQALKFGYDFGVSLINDETIAEIAAYAPSIYELLPSPTYVKKQSYLAKGSYGRSHSLPYQVIKSDPLFRVPYTPMVALNEKYHEKWDKRQLNIPQYVIVGQGHQTLKGYLYNDATFVFYPQFDDASGDGTVPLISADHQSKEFKKKYYVVEEHGSLMKNVHVIHQVTNLLMGREEVLNGLTSTPRKQFDFNYYVIYREDGKTPTVKAKMDGDVVDVTQLDLERKEKLRVEQHGSILVVHAPMGTKLRQLSSTRQSKNSQDHHIIYVEHFSSERSLRNVSLEQLAGELLLEIED